jgi:hypothetical protein
MRASRAVLAVSVVACAFSAAANGVRLDLLTSFETVRVTLPIVFWANDRVCVPSREGYLCHDVGPIPRQEPLLRPAALTGQRPVKGRFKLAVGNDIVVIHPAKELIESAGPDAGVRLFRDSYCPLSGRTASEWLVVVGARSDQVALLRRERHRRTTACLDAAPDCQLDEYMETWSLLLPVTKCEVGGEENHQP